LKEKENLKLKATVNGKKLIIGASTDFWKYIQLHKAYPIDVKLLEVRCLDSCICCLYLYAANNTQFRYKFGLDYEKMPEPK
jgi:hypothetical protein